MTTENSVFQYHENNPTNLPDYIYYQYFEVFEDSDLLEFLNGAQNADITIIDNIIFNDKESKKYNNGWRDDPKDETVSVEMWKQLHYSFEDISQNNNTYKIINVENGKNKYKFVDLDTSIAGFEQIEVGGDEYNQGNKFVKYILTDMDGNGYHESIQREVLGMTETYTSSKDNGIYDLFEFNSETNGELNLVDLNNPYIFINAKRTDLIPINPEEYQIKFAIGLSRPSKFVPIETTINNIANPGFFFSIMNGDLRKK